MLTTASRIVEGYFGGQEIREATDQYDAQLPCESIIDEPMRILRDGKSNVLRKAMRSIAHGHNEPPPSTIEDPHVLPALRPVLHR